MPYCLVEPNDVADVGNTWLMTEATSILLPEYTASRSGRQRSCGIEGTGNGQLRILSM